MFSSRWSKLTLLIAFLELVGCAVPPAIPPAPTPADLIKAIPQGNNTTVVNVASPQHQTLPDFLGITRCCYGTIGACNTVRNQVAFCFPGLAGVIEPGAGVLSIADAEGGSPAVETAAKIKAEEDQAQAKIAALRYLATIGCAGCYPGVEEAFIAALDDCTEVVRYEAVMALLKTKCMNGKCDFCNKKACCSAKIQKKLNEIAYETDDEGCFKESSERVRRKARLALRRCGPAALEPTTPEPVVPAPVPGPVDKGAPATPPATTPPATPATPPADNPPLPPPSAPLL